MPDFPGFESGYRPRGDTYHGITRRERESNPTSLKAGAGLANRLHHLMLTLLSCRGERALC